MILSGRRETIVKLAFCGRRIRMRKRIFVLLLTLALFQTFSYLYAEELFDGSADVSTQDFINEDVTGETVSEICEEPLASFYENSETEEVSAYEEMVSINSVGDTITYVPNRYDFTVGSGYSGTQVKINPDWSFEAETHDGEMMSGQGYSYTVFFARVLGQFGEPVRLNEYSYSFPVLSSAPQYEAGYEYIENDTRYAAIGSEGLVDTDRFILYLPGTPVSVFSENDLVWVNRFADTSNGVIGEGSYILQNPGTGMIFAGEITSEKDRLMLPAAAPIPTPTPIALSDEPPAVTGFYNSVKGADIRWTKVPGARGYYIYRKRAADGTKKVGTVNDPEAVQFYDDEIKDNCWGRVYVYYVVPYAGDAKGQASTQVTLQRLAPMKITECQNTSAGSAKLAWACTVNENKALGYEIQYAGSKNDLYGRTGSFRKLSVNDRNNLSKTIKGLEAGKTYYFRIRCWVNYKHSVTGKVTKTWSQYSDVVSVKITR